MIKSELEDSYSSSKWRWITRCKKHMI